MTGAAPIRLKDDQDGVFAFQYFPREIAVRQGNVYLSFFHVSGLLVLFVLNLHRIWLDLLQEGCQTKKPFEIFPQMAVSHVFMEIRFISYEICIQYCVYDIS